MNAPDLHSPAPNPISLDFTPTRAAGLARLQAFAPHMGRDYAARRNHDHGPTDRGNVSALSPWVRHRRVGEWELAAAAVDELSLSAAEKFIQEVCWRAYFKGWLEHRPGVWRDYQIAVRAQLDHLDHDGPLRADYDTAVAGRTGIDCFDAWTRELVDTGYLHNHTRMWFASIWVYTLNLPWELGAEFFLRHLMDADAASNTCSWRWVCGLHTAGKTYLARPSNIEKFTKGRFAPTGLALMAEPVQGDIPTPVMPPPADPAPEGTVALLLTEDDLHVETLRPAGATVRAIAALNSTSARSPLGVGERAGAFTSGVLEDALAAGEAAFEVTGVRLPSDDDWLPAAIDWARDTQCERIVTGYAPTGWGEQRMRALRAGLAEHDITLHAVRRLWDGAFWPYAKKGFFGLNKAIPSVLATPNLLSGALA